jgi:hypothetical protein
MPDARDLGRPRDGGPPPGGPVDLVAALRALPQHGPGLDAWPALADRLGAARRRHRRLHTWLPLAAAAALVIAVLMPRMTQVDPDAAPADPAVAAVDDAARTRQLIAQSQWLERLASAPALAPVAQDGDQALLEIGLRERIGRIDAALADPDGEPGPSLWQARVSALDELVQVRWAGRQVALADTGPEPAALTPAVLWSN